MKQLPAILFGTIMALRVVTMTAAENPAEQKSGTFNVTFKNGIVDTVTGQAVFVIQKIADRSVCKIILYRYLNDSNFVAVNLLLMDTHIPKAGTYTVGGRESVPAAFMIASRGEMTLGSGDSGRLLITDSGELEIKGSFTFTGDAMKLGADETLTHAVMGTFAAVLKKETELPTAIAK